MNNDAASVASAPPRTVNLAPLRAASRWGWPEYAFWLLPIIGYFVFSDSRLFVSQIAITGLFALSLDLILGYAGIISLGHAAFFGIGAYTAGLLAKHGFGDPLLGLFAALLLSAAAGYVTSFLVLRGSDLTRLMVTMGVSLMLFEAANKLTEYTGGIDGLQGVEVKPVLGLFTSTSTATPPTSTVSSCCSCCSGSRGASCIRRSARASPASARTSGACRRWARRCTGA